MVISKNEMARYYLLTAIGVCLGAVSVLESIGPGALVLGVADDTLAHSVATFVALRPLAAV